MKCLFIWYLVVLLALNLTPATSVRVSAVNDGMGGYIYFNSFVNSSVGYSDAIAGPYTNPGPTYAGMNNQTFQIYLYATDERLHVFYIDINHNRMIDVGDLLSSDYYSRGASWLISLRMDAGTYTYRDATLQNLGGWTDSGISGTIQVNAPSEPPKSWWQWEPFWIFGLFVEVALVLWILYMVFQGLRMWRAKRKLKQTSPEIHKWLKATMDPESPTRLTLEYVANIKLGKKKIKAERDAEREKGKNGDDPFKLPKVYRFPRLHRRKR